LRVRKKWWLAPIVILLLTLGLILVVTEGSVLAPFIYSLFQRAGLDGAVCADRNSRSPGRVDA
jgi:hypothetical protein